MILFAIFVTMIFLYSLVSSRLDRTVITAPIVFTTAGVLTQLLVVPSIGDSEQGIHLQLTLAEVGLVLLLFADAYKTDLRILKSFRNLPVRLLSTGMLLTIALGLVAAKLIFPSLSIWEAGILAAILAPTDAGLGQIIVNSPRVPLKIRQSLNVEAGLNDGLSVPFMLFFIALAAGSAAGESSSLMKYIVEQLGYGAVIGIVVGIVGGKLLRLAANAQWISHTWSQLGLLALPLLCLLASDKAGASMFIAAFVGGMAARVGSGYEEEREHLAAFTEDAGQLFNLLVFFLFGIIVAVGVRDFDLRSIAYAVISLTIVRMLPVAIALIKTRLSSVTVLFMGWFGPRGLASIVLGLVYLEHEYKTPGEATIRHAVMATVLISIFTHGLSALPGIALYEKRITALTPDASEFHVSGSTDKEEL